MRVNTLLVRWAGGWTERKDLASIAAVGRIEARLDLGSITSLPEAHRVADAQLAEFARERTQTDIGIMPAGSDVPYVDFNVGDTVTVEGVSHRVLGLTVSVDQVTGRPIYIPTLNDDIVLGPDERVFQTMRKMLNGTLGGRSKVAQPVVPVARPLGRAPIPAADCLSDSFTAADDTFPGADLTWQSGTAGLTATVATSSTTVYGDEGDNLAHQGITVQSNTAAAKMPDDSLLGVGEHYWRLTELIRPTTALSTADMRVSATISGLAGGGSNGGYWLVARSFDAMQTPQTDLQISVPVGWQVEWDDGYVALYCNYISSVSSPGNVESFLVVDDSPAITLAPGDLLAITVTGPTATPTITVEYNGGTVLFADSGTGYGAGPFAGDTDADYPDGMTGCLGFIQTAPGGPPTSSIWNHLTMDNTMSLDDWEACPA